MSIHAFFECLAVGLQKTPLGILGLASAIIVHKWAEGLTLGLIYRKENYSRLVRTMMIFVQAIINVAGLCVGTIIIDQGSFVMAFFMSISAGTFLYISLA
jgi:zinc transporter 1/2/3